MTSKPIELDTNKKPSNMSTQTEFDKELKKILNSSPYNGRVISMSPEYLKEAIFNWRIEAIKQAVEKYVIGEDEVFIDIPVVGITGEIESIISGKSFTPLMVAKNQFRIQQRLALSGGKNK